MLVAVAALLLQASAPPVGPPPDSSVLRHSDGRVPPTVTAARVTRAPALDGRLDDAAWRLAVPVSGFVQTDPNEGKAATESTVVMVLYDGDAIYVGARLFDSEPHRIEQQLGRRDAYIPSDRFSLTLDSYHDHRTGFSFTVNPAGVKRDELTSNDASFGDDSWDPVWEAATAVDSLGWVAEMRIPFSQLRFTRAPQQVWGINFFRTVFRKNEFTQFVFKAKTETGFASRFAHLVGLADVRSPRRLEILPYTVAHGAFDAAAAPGDPFDDGSVYAGNAGVDLKYGITSNLTLEATVNPDFGQVEIDPAFVNLSAFEQFLPERRPFFVEGQNIFAFRGRPDFIYSRRIGRAPQGGADARGGYVDRPENTSILGAVKLTGRTAGGWSVGVLDAVTAREFAQVRDSLGAAHEDEVEPFANYFAARINHEMRGGKSGYGILATAVNRDIGTPALASLRRSAYAGGVDFFHRWHNNAYTLDGSLGFSYITGDTVAIKAAQRSSARYYQRPDADHVDYDPTRTSLAGSTWRVALDEDAGAWTWRLDASGNSPGFEVNDLGLQFVADDISAGGQIRRRWTRPGKIVRNANVRLFLGMDWNYGGVNTGRNVGLFSFGQFLNYWGWNAGVFYTPSTLNDRLTRGGPLARSPGSTFVNFGFFSDNRKRATASAFAGYGQDAAGGWDLNLYPYLNIRPSSAVSLSVGPGYSVGRSSAQFVQPVTDATATATYGHRYVFAELQSHSVNISVRANLTLSPTLTFELFAQPFAFAADYETFKELRAPRTYDFVVYGRDNGSTVTPGDTTVCGGSGPNSCSGIDPDGGGPAPTFPLFNPDFRTRSLRTNAVLRWEYRPGSTLFIVWTQSRSGFSTDPRFLAGRDLGDLLLFRRDRPTNVLLVKVNYWMSL